MKFLQVLPDVITFIFLLTLISYYFLLFIPKKKPKKHRSFKSISVLIPAHNEEEYIADCLRSVLAANFRGEKEIIVVDDGSIDRTCKIARSFEKRYGIKVLKTKHSGKSSSLNLAMKHAKGELVAVVDADSIIYRNALVEMEWEVSRKNTVASACVVKVKNRHKILCIYPHIELLYNSLIRSILSKVNANITTPGPLSVYRRKNLDEIGGFSTEGFSEDVDVTIRLIRKGYHVGFTEKAIAETNMPPDMKGFLRQRFRFGRGLVNILKRHLQMNKTVIDLYTLPLFLFAYVQAVVMGSFTIYQIVSGYLQYFVSQGVYFSTGVLQFFIDWLTIIGFVKWTYNVFVGSDPITVITLIGIMSTFLSYPLFIYSVIKFDRKIDFFNIIPIFIMQPFWWFMMIVYMLSLPEMVKKSQYNIWKKNE